MYVHMDASKRIGGLRSRSDKPEWKPAPAERKTPIAPASLLRRTNCDRCFAHSFRSFSFIQLTAQEAFESQKRVLAQKANQVPTETLIDVEGGTATAANGGPAANSQITVIHLNPSKDAKVSRTSAQHYPTDIYYQQHMVLALRSAERSRRPCSRITVPPFLNFFFIMTRNILLHSFSSQ